MAMPVRNSSNSLRRSVVHWRQGRVRSCKELTLLLEFSWVYRHQTRTVRISMMLKKLRASLQRLRLRLPLRLRKRWPRRCSRELWTRQISWLECKRFNRWMMSSNLPPFSRLSAREMIRRMKWRIKVWGLPLEHSCRLSRIRTSLTWSSSRRLWLAMTRKKTTGSAWSMARCNLVEC